MALRLQKQKRQRQVEKCQILVVSMTENIRQFFLQKLKNKFYF